MPPPYPVFRSDAPLVGQRKVVYRTRAPEPKLPALPGDSAANRPTKSGGSLAIKSKGPLPPPRAAPPLTQKELNAINRRKERELRAYERRTRLRSEMGEEAWAAEQRRKEENMVKKKIQYQTTKKCKDAIEWTQDAAKVPTTQTLNRPTTIQRTVRACQVLRQLAVRRGEKWHDSETAHFETDDGVFVRLHENQAKSAGDTGTAAEDETDEADEAGKAAVSAHIPRLS